MGKNYVNTGTASATNGSKTVTFAGVSMGLIRAGGMYMQGGASGVLDSVDTGAGTAQLAENWGGETSDAQPYTLLTIPENAELAADIRELMASLTGPILTIAALNGGSFPANGHLLIAQDSDWATVASTGSDEVVRKTNAVLVTPTLGVAAATTLNVGGSSGGSQVNVEGSTPSISVVKSGVVEYVLTTNSDSDLVLGYPSAPFYHHTDGKLTVGLKPKRFSNGVLFGVGSTVSPKRAILKDPIVEFIETVNGSNYLEWSANGHSVVFNAGGGTLFGPGVDNDMSCGGASNRWTEIYAASGTINTSAGEAKYQPRALNEAEIAVAKALAQNVRVYQFVDAVEKKGADHARMHFGHIFEDVVAAFEAQGLDPMRYGIVCQNEATKLVQKTRQVQRQKVQPVEVDAEVVSMQDGKAVLNIEKVTQQKHAFAEYPVVDPAGKPVLDEKGVQRVHRVPVMETVDESYQETVPDLEGDGTAKFVKALRYGELTQFIIAGMAAT